MTRKGITRDLLKEILENSQPLIHAGDWTNKASIFNTVREFLNIIALKTSQQKTKPYP